MQRNKLQFGNLYHKKTKKKERTQHDSNKTIPLDTKITNINFWW